MAENTEWKLENACEKWQWWSRYYRGILLEIKPIFVEDSHIGYIVKAHRTQRSFTEFDLEVLKPVAIELADYHLECQQIRAIPDWREAQKCFANQDNKYPLLNELKEKQIP